MFNDEIYETTDLMCDFVDIYDRSLVHIAPAFHGKHIRVNPGCRFPHVLIGSMAERWGSNTPMPLPSIPRGRYHVIPEDSMTLFNADEVKANILAYSRTGLESL